MSAFGSARAVVTQLRTCQTGLSGHGGSPPPWLDSLLNCNVVPVVQRIDKTWQVNAGWVLAANIAADLTAWTRLLGLHDGELRDADPDTLRYRIWHLPARLARHARQRTLAISADWPWKDAFLACWQRLRALPAPA